MAEKELIARIKNKDKAAIKELYIRYSSIMLGLCMRYCGNREDAKDIMHECFIKIITQIDKYSGLGNFEGWMKRIMINASLDFYKSKRKNEHIEINEEHQANDLEDESTFNQLIDKKDFSEKVDLDIVLKAEFTKEEIIDSLFSIPEKYRIIFNLFVIENYNHVEIAHLLGFDEKVSRTRLFRAKEMIKKILSQKSMERLTK